MLSDENKKLFGSKFLFRVFVCLGVVMSIPLKPIIFFPLPILLFILNVSSMRWLTVGHDFIWIVLTYVFIILMTIFASVMFNLLMFPLFTFLYLFSPIGFEEAWGSFKGLSLNDFTPYVAYFSSLIYYIIVVYYCRKALKGESVRDVVF